MSVMPLRSKLVGMNCVFPLGIRMYTMPCSSRPLLTAVRSMAGLSKRLMA